MTDYLEFEEFVVARRDALLRTAYLLTGNHHDAEDLVQSALIKVVPKWTRIKDRPEGYVRQVLARESVSRWRRRRWREVATDAVPETMHLDSTDRTHFDLWVDPETSTPAAEVERLIALGAERVEDWTYPPNADFVVLKAPDGTVFCVIG